MAIEASIVSLPVVVQGDLAVAGQCSVGLVRVLIRFDGSEGLGALVLHCAKHTPSDTCPAPRP